MRWLSSCCHAAFRCLSSAGCLGPAVTFDFHNKSVVLGRVRFLCAIPCSICCGGTSTKKFLLPVFVSRHLPVCPAKKHMLCWTSTGRGFCKLSPDACSLCAIPMSFCSVVSAQGLVSVSPHFPVCHSKELMLCWTSTDRVLP